jgi:hypothetical protein
MPPRSKWTDEQKRDRARQNYEAFIQRNGILYPYYALMASRQRIAADGMKLVERVNGRLPYTVNLTSCRPLAEHERADYQQQQAKKGDQ